MTDNIDAGDLRHSVQLWRINPNSLPNAVGDPGRAYTLVGNFYSLVTQTTGDAPVSSEQKKGVRHYTILMRARQINPTDYIVWHGKKINVISSITDPFGISTTIQGTEQITPV